MGKIGFVFEIFSHEVFEKKDVYFENKKVEMKYIVVFISTKKTNSDIILGLSDFFHQSECIFSYLNSNLGFSHYLLLENSIYKYAKVCVYDRKVVDYIDLTFWFDAKKYKEVREILTLNNLDGNLEDELRKRVLKILDFI